MSALYNKYKWKVLDSSVFEGSSAVRVENSFEYSEKAYFESFQKNLNHLKNKVSLLSFMVEEIRETLDHRKSS